jgi:hypothetical protein
LAPYEGDAIESLKDPAKAQYFVRTGGTCDWCQSKRGTIVRLLPKAVIAGENTESLLEIGIKDPNTDIAIWLGKNNVGRKQQNWWICCPAHPHNVATFQPINLKDEYYNPKTDDVEHRQKKYKFVPQMTDYTEKIKQEEGPVIIGDNLVQFNNNVYQAVNHDEYNFKLDAWKRNKTLPIPVDKNSTSYNYFFERTKKI